MYMKVFPHGQGGGDGPTHYLVRPDYPGRDELPPEVLRGDVDTTRALIDSLDTKWKFTAGVLSWHPDDKVTAEQERRVMDDFEQVAFAGLEPDQRNILWVRHSHAGHHELHFVIPRVELSSGKALNPCPPGWQKHFDVFRDLYNHREGWARPDDPARARLHTPEHADLHKARLLRWGKTPGKDERTEAKQAIHDYLRHCIEQGTVTIRTDVLTALQGAGLEINRAGKEYITVKDQESGEKLRLKGGIYAEHWKLELSGRTHESQSRAGATGIGSPDPATTQRLAAELERVVEKRAQYNRGRYPASAIQLGTEREHPLPYLELDVRPQMAANPAHNREHPDGRSLGRMGIIHLGREQGHGLTAGDSRAWRTENSHGENRCTITGPDLGVGLSRKPAGSIHRPANEKHLETRLDNRQEPGLETGVSHDRTGTHPHQLTDHDGAGTDRQPGNPQKDTGRAKSGYSTFAGTGQPDTGRTAGIRAALATLERYTRELGTALVAFERHIERQIERARERQHSRGPRMGR